MTPPPKKENWIQIEFDTVDLEHQLLMDPQRISSDGQDRCFQLHDKKDSPLQGIRFANPLPLVDIHCHLVPDYAENIPEPSKEILEKIFRQNFLRYKGADQNVSFACLIKEFPKASLNKLINDNQPKFSRFFQFSVVNGLVENLPHVLDAPRSFGSTKDPNSECWSQPPTICVPLALDLAFTPIFAADPERRMPGLAEFALSEANRFIKAKKLENPSAMWLKALEELDGDPTPKTRMLIMDSLLAKSIEPLVKLTLRAGATLFPSKSFHTSGFYPDSEIGYTILDPKRLETSLESFSYIATGSRGSVMPFLPFEPRRFPSKSEVQKYLTKWITTEKSKGKGFVGLKFYTRCGWRLVENECFYPDKGSILNDNVGHVLGFAQKEGIPITNHHSPAGWPPKDLLVPPIGYKSCDKHFYNAGKSHGKIPRLTSPIFGKTSNIQAQNIAESIVWHAATEVASYCDYVTKTASPSIWDTPLKMYPKLVINLAHSGTLDAAVLHYFGDSVVSRLSKSAFSKTGLSSELGEEWSYLIDHPMIAPTRYFSDLFWVSVLKKSGNYVDQLIQGKELPSRFTSKLNEIDNLRLEAKEWEFNTDTEFAGGKYLSGSELEKRISPRVAAWNQFSKNHGIHLREAAGGLRRNKEWIEWIRSNKSLGWYGKTLKMAAQYESTYFDLSYFASDSEKLKWILHYVLRDIFDSHPNSKKLSQRVMLGTDWFLTEQDLGSAHKFWATFQEAHNETGLGQREWELLTSLNAIRFLGISRRHKNLKDLYTDEKRNRFPSPWFSHLSKALESRTKPLKIPRTVSVATDNNFAKSDVSVCGKNLGNSYEKAQSSDGSKRFLITDDECEVKIGIMNKSQPFSIPLCLNKSGEENRVFLSRPPSISFAFESELSMPGLNEELICFELDTDKTQIREGRIDLEKTVNELLKNKLFHDVIGNSSHLKDSWEALKEFGNNTGYIKKVKGKLVLIIRGTPGRSRTIGGFLKINRREKIHIMKNWDQISSQAQFAKLNFGFNKAGLNNWTTALKSNSISILAFASFDAILEMHKDESVWTDVGITFTSGVVQGAVSAMGSFVAAASLFALVPTAPIWAVSAGAFAVGMALSYGLRWLDEELEITDSTKSYATMAKNSIKEWWDETINSPTAKWLHEMEQAILRLYGIQGF